MIRRAAIFTAKVIAVAFLLIVVLTLMSIAVSMHPEPRP